MRVKTLYMCVYIYIYIYTQAAESSSIYIYIYVYTIYIYIYIYIFAFHQTQGKKTATCSQNVSKIFSGGQLKVLGEKNNSLAKYIWET